MLKDLERRGLPSEGLLFVVDGGSGLNKALNEKYAVEDKDAKRAIRVRCFFHKWNNLKDVLTEEACAEVKSLFWAIREAKNLATAQACSTALESTLRRHNISALRSFQEAKDDLENLNRLSLSPDLRRFFSTTNAIESLNSLLEEDLRRVKRWRNSEHFQRWFATSCLAGEEKMRRINGHLGMDALAVSLHSLYVDKNNVDIFSKAM